MSRRPGCYIAPTVDDWDSFSGFMLSVINKSFGEAGACVVTLRRGGREVRKGGWVGEKS